MGIFDLFSGSSGRNAAIWSAGNTQEGANKQRDYVTTGADQGLAALGAGYTQGRSDLTNAYNTAANTTMGQYGQSYGQLGQGTNAAAANLGQTYNILSNYGQQADSYWQPLATQANTGYSQYGDATGVNGAQGYNRARTNFRTAPGYAFTVDEGVNAATRAANATGMGASGNTLDATTRLGSHLADQEWDDYLASLSPYLDKATDIAAARTGISQHTGDALAANQTNIANLYNQYGKDTAKLSSDYGTSLSNLATNTGSSLSNLAGNYGTGQSNIYTALGNSLSNITGAETNTITGQGQAGLTAGQTANANTWNAGMELANLLASVMGKSSSSFK